MEFDKSPEEGNKGSPSQNIISHGQQPPMKREIESLEDFEDLTKDITSMKDATAQFLKFESNDRKEAQPGAMLLDEVLDTIQQPSNESDSSQDFKNTDKTTDELFSFLSEPAGDTEKKTGFGIDPEPQVMDFMSDPFGESNGKGKHDAISKAFDEPTSDILNFKQTEFDDTNAKSNFPEPSDTDVAASKKTELNDLSDEKFVNLEKSDSELKGIDDAFFMPKKGESSPLLHSGDDDIIKPLAETRPTKKPDSPTLTRYTSEPGITREHESQRIEEAGIHMNKGDEGDQSDGDDFVPEPIPKDYPEIGVIEGKQFLAAIGLDTWFHPHLLNPKIESLVYWRDPKKSGIVFGSVLVILLSLTTFSLISVIAYSSLLILAVALGFRVYKNVLGAVQKTSEGHPFKEYLDIDLTLNPDKAREISDVVVSYVNWAVTKSRSLFLVEDIIDSIKFGVLLWCMTYVGSWFNGLSLLIIAFVGLFTLPKVYENNKTQIDANLNIVRSKLNEVTEKIKAVSPLGKKADDSKDKNE